MRLFIAWLLSFRKREWSLRDYPIRVNRQMQDPQRFRREPLPPWSAIIMRWGLAGIGDTRDEALERLQVAFDEYRARHDSLPRPGTHIEIIFAANDRISRCVDVARQFFPPILNVSYDDCFISDESSVWDFPIDYDANELARRSLLIFGTDIGDLAEGGNIAAILERIAAHRRGSS